MIPSLFFTASVQHAMDLSETMRAHGVRVYPISGKTPDLERKRLIRLMREGGIDGLASCDLLSVGTDIPIAMGAFMARSTKSGLWYRQAVGRVLRPFPAPQGERAYQQDAIRSIALAVKRGCVNQLLVMPTGTGKTSVAARLPKVLKWWKEGGTSQARGRILFLCHREELVYQTADTFRMYNPSMTIGIEKADCRAESADLVIASVQTLGQDNGSRIAAFDPRNFDAVISDEAHWQSKLHTNIYKHFHVLKGDESRDPGILHLGMTATPARADGIGLEKHYDEIVYVYDIRKAIKDGWLAKIVAYRSETTVDISNVGTRGDDLAPEALAKTINTPERNEIIAQKYMEVCELEGMTGTLSNIGQFEKKHAIIVDFADLSGRHSLIGAATLFGLRSTFNAKGKDLIEQVEEIERIEQEHPTLNLREAPNMDSIHATLQSIDLLAAPIVPPEIAKYSKFGWLSDGPGAYHMGLMDHRVLTVRENTLGQWEVYEHSRGLVNHLWTVKTLKEALALGEKSIPKKDVPVLRVGAQWQAEPPTDKQAFRIWTIDFRVRKHYASANSFYAHCKDQYDSGNESYSKGGLSRKINSLETV